MSGYEAPWRRSLRPASFRGVPFFVRTAQTQVGRRVQFHEYPQRDEVFSEDLGLKADAFTIEAVVIGPDYFKARDALIAALKERGAGKLIHPFYGERRVALQPPARISETMDEGGMARFSLDFIEARDDALEPSTRVDTQDVVEAAADTASTAVADDFATSYSVDGEADFVADSALSLAGQAMGAMDALRRNLVPDLSVLSEYMAVANGVAGSLSSLIRAPAAFAQSVLGMIGSLKALAMSPVYALASYRGLFDYGHDRVVIPAATPSRRRQMDNQAAMDGLVRRIALVEGSRVASRADYPTYDQAVAVRDDLAGRLDAEACAATSDAVYRTLTALRVALVRDLTARAIIAPRISSATLPATLPAVVAAYRIYGDAKRADEILSRNPAVRHPGFVPGGAPLEIITD